MDLSEGRSYRRLDVGIGNFGILQVWEAIALCVVDNRLKPDRRPHFSIGHHHPQVREVSSPVQGIPRLCGPIKNGIRHSGGAPVRYFFLALRDAFRAYRRSKQYHYPSNIDGRRRY